MHPNVVTLEIPDYSFAIIVAQMSVIMGFGMKSRHPPPSQKSSICGRYFRREKLYSG